MIVKVKNSEEGWSYLECDIVHSKFAFFSDLEKIPDALILFDKCPGECEKRTVKILNLETNARHLRTILTDRVCYILNDEGKTIDKV